MHFLRKAKSVACPRTALLLAMLLGASSAAVSQELAAQPPASPDPASSPVLLPHGGATLERYFENLRIAFEGLDADLDGKITESDADLHALMEGVMLRTLASQYVMRFDLDGDGVVTEDEIRRGSRYYLRSASAGAKQKIEDDVRSMMALDIDKDGKVSFVEASKFTFPEMLRLLGFPGVSARARRALTLKVDSKDGVALQDYKAAGEALFRKIDADHDGKISHEELAAFRQLR